MPLNDYILANEVNIRLVFLRRFRGHEGMTIGIRGYRSSKQVSWLPCMLVLPFIDKVSDYVINRRSWGKRDE